jgi:tetratricopeptide (TPR) repeat protein
MSPGQLREQFKLAFSYYQNSQNDLADFIFSKILELKPDHFDSLLLRGIINVRKNAFIALDLVTKATNVSPNNPSGHYNLGLILEDLKLFDKALDSYECTVRLRPDFADAWLNRGNVLHALMNLDDAVRSYDFAISIKPDFSLAYYNRGLVLKELNRFEEAKDSYDNAIRLSPDFADAYCNRAVVLEELNRFEEAIENYDIAIRIKPGFALAYYNRGVVLKELNRFKEAKDSYDNAIRLRPDFADAYCNRAIVLEELNRFQAAIENYDIAIRIKPDFANAKFNKSINLLLNGNLNEGFVLYEFRWEKRDPVTKRNFDQPLWLGTENIEGKTILIHSEQGYGDTIQFCRYAKLVKERGARVAMEVPEALLRLMAGLEGVDELVEKGNALPAFDFHCPLMSLPLAFNTTIESIPHLIPYIHSNIDKEDKWRVHIGNSGFKIAICWQGSTKGKVDIGRSFPVSLFEGLAKINDVRLISLQKNEGVEQLKNLPAGMRVETLPDDFDNGDNAFLDSACVMKCVDLVITSDTALTHLAGALGVKTWLPLKYVPDWRWMLETSSSPWYPNHRLFRQAIRGEWGSVFKAMELELRALVLTK